METLQDIVKIINELENTSSTKGKQFILEKNKDNGLLKKVLWYAYNSNVYGLSKTTINKMKYEPNDDKSEFNNLWIMFDTLAKSNINDNLRNEVRKHLNYYSEDVRELIIKILLKDMKCGIGVKLVNTVFPNLIETFELMKASSYDDKSKVTFCKKAKKVGYHMMIKENGIRGAVIIDGDTIDDITIKSRQNEIFEGMNELKQAFLGMPKGVYEGELLTIGCFNTSKEQFKATTKILSTKGEKKGIMIKLFDYITLEDFNVGYSYTKALRRKEIIEDILMQHNNNSDLIDMINILYIGNNTNKIDPFLERVSEGDKYEGLMIQLNDAPYEAKRVKTELKVKKWKTIDLRVVDIKESKERPGTMGSAIVMYKGKPCGVSGWKEKEKEYYWKNSHELIGKIIEIKYKEVTVDKNGNESLQFPNVVMIRLDKDEESYD